MPSRPEDEAIWEEVDWKSEREAWVMGERGVVAGVEAKVWRRWVESGEGVAEVRGGSSRRRER